eukprot:TRINITY_DN1295_c0_g2_i1.p3 TRINITY_DN1295_c0_g2~~TRINITY_DN1295_c0_g2_i1.p3  ORF type:complete len:172 (-),score=34.00 TRINITY_DN1295_c0_g2_i1:35-550(-)
MGSISSRTLKFRKKVREGVLRFPKIRFSSKESLDLILKCLRKDPLKRISFSEIIKHPFFSKDREFEVFDKVFDGFFGYFEVSIANTHDLLLDPNCLKIPEPHPDIFELHNLEVLKQPRDFHNKACLLYTSDAADDTPCVDLGGRRIIKKKNETTKRKSQQQQSKREITEMD